MTGDVRAGGDGVQDSSAEQQWREDHESPDRTRGTCVAGSTGKGRRSCVECGASPSWSRRAISLDAPCMKRWHNIVQGAQTERTDHEAMPQLVCEGAWRRHGASGWRRMAFGVLRNAPQRLRAVGIIRVARKPTRSRRCRAWAKDQGAITREFNVRPSPMGARLGGIVVPRDHVQRFPDDSP